MARATHLRSSPAADPRLHVSGSSRYITERIGSISEQPTSRSWLLLFGLAFSICLMLGGSLLRLVSTGIGVWGNDQTVAWAWDITGFVFWIGIGHAGTLISAVLHLFRQQWRTVVARAAEAVTLIAVITAAVYPVFHIGRVWVAYWLFPFPNQMQVWPNFKSPLSWDVFAVASYFLVSAMFWYLGLVPDLATLRDRAQTLRRRRVLSWLSLGWRSSQRHFKLYDQAYLLLAGLATPLVISVHTVVSFDFAVSNVPGWHSTIFPPYFVAGAIFSGSAAVVTLIVFVRKALHLENFITVGHLEAMNKLVLATSCMLAYAYGVELFLASQTGDPFERTAILGRMTGPYAWECWVMLACNVVLPQLYWFRRVRRSVPLMIVISLGVNLGMWLERFVIVVTGQHRGYLPSTWFDFHPTIVDASTFIGTVGLFLTLFLLFVRFVPIISMNETKELAARALESHSAEFSQKALRLSRGRTPAAHEAAVLLLAAFAKAEDATKACHKLAYAGVHQFDAHAPFSNRELASAVQTQSSVLPWISLASGLVGGLGAYFFQRWVELRGYPMQIGGKPSGSWQTLIPITFEVTILCAAIGCFLGLWFLCALPDNQHAVHASSEFASASDDGFFVSVERSDPNYAVARRVFRECGARSIAEVVA